MFICIEPVEPSAVAIDIPPTKVPVLKLAEPCKPLAVKCICLTAEKPLAKLKKR